MGQTPMQETYCCQIPCSYMGRYNGVCAPQDCVCPSGLCKATWEHSGAEDSSGTQYQLDAMLS